MNKDRIIKVATSLYARYGIKAVSMNQLADTLQMSKKTIYIEFEDKEQLLLECMIMEMALIQKTIEEVENYSNSSLETVWASSNRIFSHFASFCPAFYRDISRFPGVQQLLGDQIAQLKQKYYFYFTRGIQEGEFIAEGNCRLIASIFVDHIIDVSTEYNVTMMMTFLRGLCTEKGMKVLARLSGSID